ncbi:hypothetical protein ACFOSD_09125 [Salinispirillum marinum]|uniref:Thioredoxin domain-containing protein n=2 Tax=Saccharospirillaceae TaxID=255527 RepID=A0ABV8BGP3_9GAMM
MSKRRFNAAKSRKAATEKKAKKRTPWQRLRRLKGLLVVAVGLLVVFGTAWFYQAQNAYLRDVSVIGNGSPTVVQLYDQNCSTCRQLDRNAEAAVEQVSTELQFRVLNLNTVSGRQFAQRYQGGQTTLLYFDRTGRHVNTITGVQSTDFLVNSFQQLLGTL